MAKDKSKAAGKAKASNSDASAQNAKLQACQRIKVRHILCEKQSKIEEAEAKLASGASFDDVAKEFSEDKARTGGMLGEKTRNDLVKEFADVAFELPASTAAKPTYSQAFKTTFGWHIAMVEKRL